MKYLMVVESPNKCDTLEGLLAGDGNEWKVAPSYGHIRDLPVKGSLGVNLSDYTPEYEFSPGRPGMPHTTGEQRVKRLRLLASEADMVFIATDPDREGEGIAWHLREAMRLREGQYCRVTFGSIERETVRAAVNNPRDIDMDRVHAQEARRVLDRLVGWLVSPVLSDVAGMNLSAGRVQSWVLRLIVDRERAIENFRVTNHYGAVIPFDDGKWTARWDTSSFVSDDRPYVLDRVLAQRAAACRRFRVVSSEGKDRKEAPPAPFSTATMLKAAAVSLQFSTDRTTKAAQGLFEGLGAAHGHITYHRTDSINFTDDTIAEIRAFLAGEGLPVADKPRKWKEKEAAQEGHPAIRPTDLSVVEAGNTDDERALYRLIRERALASQMAEAQYHATVLKLAAEDAQPGDAFTYVAKGRVMTFAGWRDFMKRDERDADDDGEPDEDVAGGGVPALSVGTEQAGGVGRVLDQKTSPPPRFTEASIIDALERHGVGRPSTYNSLVATLTKRSYVTLVKRLIKPTDVGTMIVDTLVSAGFAFMEMDFTRDMEVSLDAIAEGRMTYRELAEAAHRQLESDLTHVKSSATIQPRHKCPKCASGLRRVALPDKPAFWRCSNDECKHYMDDNAGKPAERKSYPCPRCDTPMNRFQRRKPKTGLVWVCPAEGCETFLDDIGGKPIALHSCKKCEAPLRRFQRKNRETNKPINKFGWVCTGETCGAFYEDDNGKPVAVKTAPCPSCGKPMHRRNGNYGWWWGCSGYADGCKTVMDDDNGKPVPKKPRKAATGGGGAKGPSRGSPARTKARPGPGDMPSRLVTRGGPTRGGGGSGRGQTDR